MLKLELQTKIADIGLPFVDVILEEIFFIPPGNHLPEKPRPVTIYDLAKISARPEDAVLQKLREIQKLMGTSHPVDPKAVGQLLSVLSSSQAPCLLDVRMRLEDFYVPVPGALHLPSLQTEEYKAALEKDQPCLVFSDDGRKAFSAAMWLREQGYRQAFATTTAAVRAALSLPVVSSDFN